jgi:hemolysin D
MPNINNFTRNITNQAEELEPNLILNTENINKDDWSDVSKDLLDSLPQVWTRGMLYFLVAFATLFVPWTILFKVDETGVARGRLEPKGNTIKLDTAVGGTVAEIKVKEGDTVQEGQSILVLDSQLINGDLTQAKDKLNGHLNQLSQLKILKNQLILTVETQKQQSQAQELEKEAQIEQVEQQLKNIVNSSTLQQAEKLAQLNQAKQTLSHSQVNNQLIERSLGGAQREVERFQKAFQEGIVSEINVVEKKEIFQERQKIYEQTKSDIEQAKLRLGEQENIYQRSIKQSQAELEQTQLRLKEEEESFNSLKGASKLAILKSEEQLKNVDREITGLQTEIFQSRNQIATLKYQLSQRFLKSPINGTVYQLPIQRPGAVVQPGNLIVELAPSNSQLIIRAQMATQESGSLRKGLAVKLKFDAYPFQDYGVVQGELLNISPTSIEVDTPSGKVAAYNLEIAVKQNCIISGNNCINFRPGDTATAEVIVRQRRIADFLLDPFKKLQGGGLKL